MSVKCIVVLIRNSRILLFSFLFLRHSCDAMCKLLSFAIATGDKRFTEIIVPGDEIPSKGRYPSKVLRFNF